MNARPTTSWSPSSALLAGCLTTLVGVLTGLDPETVLFRAVTAAAFVGVLAAVLQAAYTALRI